MQKFSLKKRDLYLNRMIAFQDTEMIKVITAIRRCGKSSLMKLWHSIYGRLVLPKVRFLK